MGQTSKKLRNRLLRTMMLLAVLYALLGQSSNNCNGSVGYNITVLSIDSNRNLAFDYYVSKYSNGTLVQYHKTGALYGRGEYVITPSESTKECYETITWESGPNAGETQCSTSSPTEDNHGSISCFGFQSEECPKECTPEFVLIPNNGFSGSFVLNPLDD